MSSKPIKLTKQKQTYIPCTHIANKAERKEMETYAENLFFLKEETSILSLIYHCHIFDISMIHCGTI